MDKIAIEVEKRIKESFWDNVNIDFHDEKWDWKHFMLFIVSDKFEWKTRIQRSQYVYEILDDLLKTDSIHALRMKLKTTSEI